MAFLIATNGPATGRRYDLGTDELIIGRHPACRIMVDEGAVSRQHCRIVREGRRFLVEDLHSRNGTFVNGQAVKGREVLRPGDKVSVCDAIFTFYGDDLEAFPDSSSVCTFGFEDTPGRALITSTLNVGGGSGAVRFSASAEIKLHALVEITQSFRKALLPDEVMPQVLESLFKVFLQADRGFLVLERGDGRLVPSWSKVRRAGPADSQRISQTIVRRAMDSQEAILSDDAVSDSRFDMSQSLANFQIRSLMCAPLIDADGRSFGALQVDAFDMKGRFTPDDLEVLAAVAAQASIAIDNARLHEESLQQRSLARDLLLAREVQKAFLPAGPPDFADYDFHHFYQPASQVGGDYFDYIPLPNGRLAVVVADVVGHGIAAAMLMAKLSAETKFCLASEPHPHRAIMQLNHRLSLLGIGQFVTMVCGVIDPGRHVVTLVNAGHMAPLHRRTDRSVGEPGADESGMPLGVIDGYEYAPAEVELAPGESLTLYTGGLHEAANADNKRFGIPRLRDVVQRSDGTPETIGRRIVDEVHEFVGEGQQDDDMCLVSFRRQR